MHRRNGYPIKPEEKQQYTLGQRFDPPPHLVILFHKARARKQRLHLARERIVRNRFQRRTRHEDILSAFELRAHFAHIFTHKPPKSVSRYGIAYLRRNREAEPLLFALQVDQNEIPRGV